MLSVNTIFNSYRRLLVLRMATMQVKYLCKVISASKISMLSVNTIFNSYRRRVGLYSLPKIIQGCRVALLP